MAQNSQPLDLEEALRQLSGQITPLAASEQLALHAARGRVLARQVTATGHIPPFPASAMDGYALCRSAWQADPAAPFEVIGESLAGHPFAGAVSGRQAVRIFTGAEVPDGADQVLLQEQVDSREADRVTFVPHSLPESYVRPVGHDMSQGQQLARAGQTLTPLVQGMLAAAGINEVTVTARPRVGVFSTGDELADPGTPLQPGQIYDSNRATVLSLLADMPVELEDLGRLPDDPEVVGEAFADCTRRCDMLITSGGVSVGDADFVTAAIRDMGQLSFWRLNLKPGKPLAYGRIGDCHLFGLPGNPVSTVVTLLLIAKPALQHLCGGGLTRPLRVNAVTTGAITHQPGRAEYQRGVLTRDNGTLTVAPTGDQSSNRMTTFAEANCLVEVPKEAEDLPAGSTVQVLPFFGLLS